jgi:hypothetical protein
MWIFSIYSPANLIGTTRSRVNFFMNRFPPNSSGRSRSTIQRLAARFKLTRAKPPLRSLSELKETTNTPSVGLYFGGPRPPKPMD